MSMISGKPWKFASSSVNTPLYRATLVNAGWNSPITPLTSSPMYAGLLMSGSSIAPGLDTRRKSLQAVVAPSAATASRSATRRRRIFVNMVMSLRR